MNNIRHTGIYVDNLEKESAFYMQVFNMTQICKNKLDKNTLLDDLFKMKNVEIATTKLITAAGVKNGTGDMIELIKVTSFSSNTKCHSADIFTPGTMHIGIGVEDIEKTCKVILENGGEIITEIHTINQSNKCVFARDPEGNWIEIIQNLKVIRV